MSRLANRWGDWTRDLPPREPEPETRPTEREATVAFWARMRAEAQGRAAQPAPEPVLEAKHYRCSVTGRLLIRTGYDFGPRACPDDPTHGAETSTDADEEALRRLAGQGQVGIAYRAHIKVTDTHMALALDRITRWGGLPPDLQPTPVPETTGRGLFGGRI